MEQMVEGGLEGETKERGENLLECQYVHHISPLLGLGSELG
jgi:hypothetical protein